MGDTEERRSTGEQQVMAEREEEEDEEVLPPGFRFHPTDEELLSFYLRRKVDRKAFSIDIIKEMDIYKHDPWDLITTRCGGEVKEWYSFCRRGRKYKNSKRPNRVAVSGFWKATGIDRPIYSGTGGDCIGLKKSLVYHVGSAGRGTKTNWMMHEFRLPPSVQDAEVWTICRIFKRNSIASQAGKSPALNPREASSNEIVLAADSSSKTNSFLSAGGGSELKLFASSSSSSPQEETTSWTTTNSRSSYCSFQWNNDDDDSSGNINDLLQVCNWDEIEGIVEFIHGG